MGPAGSLLGQMADAYRFYHQGDNWKAAESLAPKVIRDLSKTMRYYEEGVTSGSGQPIVKPEEMSAPQLIMQMIGFTPQNVQSAEVNRSGIEAAVSQFNDRKKVLLKEYAEARLANDDAAAQSARDKIDSYNAAQREQGTMAVEGIKGDEMIRAVQSRRLAAMRLDQGVSLPPRQRALRQFGSVAEDQSTP